MLLFFLAAGLIFSIAIFGAGYYVWSVPEQEAEDMLSTRLRELRTHTRIRGASRPELLRREHRGPFAFLGDLVTWVGVLRRLQEIIQQLPKSKTLRIGLLAANCTIMLLRIDCGTTIKAVRFWHDQNITSKQYKML